MDNFRLPRKWSSIGAKIEAKRPAESPVMKIKPLSRNCGMDTTFQEFVLFALKSYEVSVIKRLSLNTRGGGKRGEGGNA